MSDTPTFVKPCTDVLAHPPHLWDKWWEKSQLPGLYHPERYPERWKAVYSCPGVDMIAWTVEATHGEGCKFCEEATDSAVDAALRNGTNLESWVSYELGPEDNEIAHVAMATRV